MTIVINTHCVCDACGETSDTKPNQQRPDHWLNVRAACNSPHHQEQDFDLCVSCARKLGEMFVTKTQFRCLPPDPRPPLRRQNSKEGGYHIYVADWTTAPGPAIGPDSGDAFWDEVVRHGVCAAQELGTALVVHLDGVGGYSSGFLTQAFRRVPANVQLDFISHDDPGLLKELSIILCTHREHTVDA